METLGLTSEPEALPSSFLFLERLNLNPLSASRASIGKCCQLPRSSQNPRPCLAPFLEANGNRIFTGCRALFINRLAIHMAGEQL